MRIIYSAEREACGEVKLIEKRDLRVRINAGARTRLAKMRSLRAAEERDDRRWQW